MRDVVRDAQRIILGGTFMVNPNDRPTINDVIARLQEIAEARNVNLKAPLDLGISSRPEQRVYNDGSYIITSRSL